GVGDLDGDGIVDVALGAYGDGDGGSLRGAVYVLFLNADGTVKAEQKISSTTGGLTGPLDDSDRFGDSVAGVGDLDADGIVDVAVGAALDDDGGTSRGAVYVLFLNADGTVKAEQKISSTTGGLTGPLDDGDRFGDSVAGVGDLDGDGIVDVAVGATYDDDGGTSRGAVYVLFLNADGTVKAEQKISDTVGGLTAVLDSTDYFGDSVAGVGDVDGDGIVDVAVGAYNDDDGGSDRGAVYVLFLNADGTVKAEQKISSATGGLTGPLDDNDRFGHSAAGIGDLDGDGTIGLMIGAYQDDDGGTDRGAVYVLDLTGSVVVNSTGDSSDAIPGDGFCDTGGTNSAADPACTLRAAIEEANASLVVSKIAFDMPAGEAGHAAGVWTIAPASALPAVTAPVHLDGSTQPGASCDAASGLHTLNVFLDGTSAGAASDGLVVSGGSTIVTGLAIDGFDDNGIELASSANTVRCNFIGVGVDGAISSGTIDTGIEVSGDDNVIGSAANEDRNVISPWHGTGVHVLAGSDRTT
ncbi:MAG: hypothetical protein GY708_07475, partial [Actinomycetia bacterium]|nr:hypothetical protein [Actinomycetes bacterium]